MAFAMGNSNTQNVTQKLYGIVPNSYRDNRFSDHWSRFRFYGSQKRPLSLKTQRLIEPQTCSECGSAIFTVNDIHECAAVTVYAAVC